MKTLATWAALVALGGCGTIADGTRRRSRWTSNAEAAMCGITQNGREVVAPAEVPARHVLPRVSGNLIVTCEAPGYETGQVALIAGKNPKTVALALPVMLLNAGADKALGGIDWYQDRAYVHLVRKRDGSS